MVTRQSWSFALIYARHKCDTSEVLHQDLHSHPSKMFYTSCNGAQKALLQWVLTFHWVSLVFSIFFNPVAPWIKIRIIHSFLKAKNVKRSNFSRWIIVDFDIFLTKIEAIKFVILDFCRRLSLSSLEEVQNGYGSSFSA